MGEAAKDTADDVKPVVNDAKEAGMFTWINSINIDFCWKLFFAKKK